MGSHEKGVSRVHFYPKHNLVLSLGDDSRMKLFDSRQDVAVFNTEMKIGIPVSSDLKKDVLILATNTNQVSILDIETMLRMKSQSEYATF